MIYLKITGDHQDRWLQQVLECPDNDLPRSYAIFLGTDQEEGLWN